MGTDQVECVYQPIKTDSVKNPRRMGSLLRHVTFKTAFLGFTSLFLAGLIFVYYPSEKSDQKASLSKVSVVENQDQGGVEAAIAQGPKAGIEGKLEVPAEECKRIDLSANMNWDELKTEALKNTKLVQNKGHLEEFDNAVVYYREVLPPTEPKGNLLFLHGMKFKSLTWSDLGTLHYMACQGYRAVAIDLPGFGESKKVDVPYVSFMSTVMGKLNMKQAIIISPSMSGGYAIPFLKEHPEAFKGYVPVAPVGTNKISDEDYKTIKVPTLIIYGEKDQSLGQTSLKALQNLPNKEVVELKGADHAAYLDKPLEFHHAFLNFCDKLYE